MLKPCTGKINPRLDKSYVCLSCRVKAQQRDAHQFIRHPGKIRLDPQDNFASTGFRTSNVRARSLSSSRCIGSQASAFSRGWTRQGTQSKAYANSKLWSRTYHASCRSHQQVTAVIGSTAGSTAFPQYPEPPLPRTDNPGEHSNSIRAQLHTWNELHGHQAPAHDPSFPDDAINDDQMGNNLSRIPDERSLSWQAQEEEENLNAHSRYADGSKEGYDGSAASSVFLQMGDLVEFSQPNSDRESEVAVFVRRICGLAQCYTINGRWIHTRENVVPYSIPGWIPPQLVEPLLVHLPDATDLEDMEALSIQGTMEDLSVPREVASPIVSRLVAFHNESQAIYRKHAGALDAAHDILAHPNDLRYGSLISAATALLKIPSDQLAPSALFTVRKAITAAGFGFNIEPSSHRQTGYMQILSKEHVKSIEQVRDWLRQWQDDSAAVTRMSEKQRARHTPLPGARIVYRYIEKAKAIVHENRQNRSPTAYGTVGPSKVRIAITPETESVRIRVKGKFSQEEQEITRFMEAWCLSALFRKQPRLQAMPPLLLQATGLYPSMDLDMSTGHIFLQELGTIMPYEHRKRFDPYLLLPTSQHSRPLQLLQSRLDKMKGEAEFADSMADLRHDWKDMSVYCIDGPDAHEIDDGLSVESAGVGSDGKQQYWIHVHVANPTAFFSRDHPIAKMARHMGETVYMPDRVFPMLPGWASRYYFSLGENRPCLTVSAKMNEEGETLDHRITSGTVRKAIRLTPDEVNSALGLPTSDDIPSLVLRVGGEPSHSPVRKSAAKSLNASQIDELRILKHLANKRFNLRTAAGGIFFDIPRPEIRVWQKWVTPGLPWHNPYHQGSRTVEGDPIIEYSTQEYRNWFTPKLGTSETLVREMMLLACETSAKWCAERNIPIIYRGTTHNPEGPTPAEFRRDVLEPQIGEGGEIPMHLGIKYMKTLGPSVLHTTPIPHEIMGMTHYSKVTSPLRRYGDMILHWQIEAVLRHEARTGKSLVGQPADDQSFLPFSGPVLDTIMRGLHPRERTVMLAKRHTERFWFLMLVMRRYHFGEDGGFPFETTRVMVTQDTTRNTRRSEATGFSIELNSSVQLLDPHSYGLGKANEGDIWECRLGKIDLYMHTLYAMPLRLLERPT